ncbi:phosphoribosylamine--glycine ligase [Candidatus Chrysopegis kryptomonas]|jgi:phosphoribosylamine--glycine ligase|uniref:Phosphoribosylamine--glycine ligase n=1 Tax=Candidatus Chryseopegocella kryptomonas TaxID=1633643 RepID=A0A0P1MPU2_9BACT|nr:phosphoribosylamine--glycine ligase [Candidatus Chrysopegis kryptomonas]CUS97711.1 phosphoribosylamine--glycine ligase [Candidatus Chrysopegis kryptomonas]
MKVLVVGGGGREHALVWKIAQSKNVEKIFCAPGNAGISEIAETIPIKAEDLNSLLNFAIENKIDLTVVGPELPLSLGIVDLFESNGLKIFGPRKISAEIESSKIFAKNFMKKYGIPTANYKTFTCDEINKAENFAKSLNPPIVIKADGLAGGKGVTICESVEDAIKTIDLYLNQKIFGSAGEKIVIEEFLQGEEASVFAITDGEDFITLAPAQDYKRIFDNDMGKNTGGMGSYAPTPLIDEAMFERIKSEIIKPTIEGLKNEGRTYKGCLYCGLMITKDGPKVLEFNCRFGDPETQVVLPLLDGDIIEMFYRAIDGGVKNFNYSIKKATAICVILASSGYPDSYEIGKEIYGLEEVKNMSDVILFHAGTKKVNGKILTSGGRVIGVTAIGPENDFESTIKKVYTAVEKIKFDGMHYRTDIGKKAINYIKNKTLLLE